MRSIIVQVVLLLLVSGEMTKRSPLQIGLVSFPFEKQHHSHNITHKSGISPLISVAHNHKWVPGHVRHHSYIPAHLHHFYIPPHALLLANTVMETVFVHSTVYTPYRSHIGGFGVGVDMGGAGAGHGFHVVLNF